MPALHSRLQGLATTSGAQTNPNRTSSVSQGCLNSPTLLHAAGQLRNFSHMTAVFGTREQVYQISK